MKNTFGKRMISGVTAALLAVSSLNSLFALAAKEVFSVTGGNKTDDVTLLTGIPSNSGGNTITVKDLRGETVEDTIANYDKTYLLGIAADFSVFLEENLTIRDSDAEGRTAVGGDIYNYASWDYEIAKGDFEAKTPLEDLLGRIDYASIILGGAIRNREIGDNKYKSENYKKLVINYESVDSMPSDYYWEKLNTDRNDQINKTKTYVTKLFTFSDEYAKLITRSAQLARSTDSGTVSYDDDSVIFRYNGNENDLKECVYFTISADDFSKYTNASRIYFENIPKLPIPREVVNNDGTPGKWERSYIVINVEGKGEIHITNPDNHYGEKYTSINGTYISRQPDDDGSIKHNNDPGVTSILYNFYEADEDTTIVLGTNFQGTILAPKSHVTDEQSKGHGGHGHLSGA